MTEPTWPGLVGRYDDGRTLYVDPSSNYELAVRVGDGEPMFFPADDLLALVFDAWRLARDVGGS
jgi:hypothetical protein